MNKWFTIMQMLPGILALIQQVENMIPGTGNGKKKLDVVLSTVNAAAQSVPEVATALQNHDLNATVTAVATASVTSLKAAGVFQQTK